MKNLNCFINHNDNIITTALVTNIMNECRKQKNNFKLISYMDQVYPGIEVVSKAVGLLIM